jgi:hypothetical protein
MVTNILYLIYSINLNLGSCRIIVFNIIKNNKKATIGKININILLKCCQKRSIKIKIITCYIESRFISEFLKILINNNSLEFSF